jgi:uncharacterized membrane protein YeaQ/YmgE (transglycosylase-associated protein family)
MHILWTVIIGFFVGLLARAITPGEHRMGFILTSLLGIAGAVVATFGGQALHFYRPGQSAGFIGATIGAFAVLTAGGVLRKMLQ